MKKLVLFLLFIITAGVQAQNYPFERVDLLQGKELKVLPLPEYSQKYGYYDFYKDEALTTKYKGKVSTPYDELVDKIFKVKAIDAAKFGSHPMHRLTLHNPETGVIYYMYDPKNDSHFKFEVVGGLTFPDRFFCGHIKSMGPLGGRERKQFPALSGIIVDRYDDGQITMLINTASDAVIADAAKVSGLVITFENGKTIALPKEIVQHKVRPAGGTQLTTVFTLDAVKDKTNIDLLKNQKVVKIKQGTEERNYTDGYLLQEYFKCGI